MSDTLRVHPLAMQDAEEIATFIGKRSIQGMHNWLDAYEQAQLRLLEDPTSYGRISDPVATEREIQQTFFKTKHGNRYRIVYTIDGDCVVILRIRSRGQQHLGSTDLPSF